MGEGRIHEVEDEKTNTGERETFYTVLFIAAL
jgi:hypothetical protein